MLPFQQRWQNLLLTSRGDHLSGFADEANISVYLVLASWACWEKHIDLKMFCAVKVLENSWIFPADLPVALVASFVQRPPNKEDTGSGQQAAPCLVAVFCYSLSVFFYSIFASPTTAGDSEHQTQTGNTEGTSCTLCQTRRTGMKNLWATSPGGRFPWNDKTLKSLMSSSIRFVMSLQSSALFLSIWFV